MWGSVANLQHMADPHRWENKIEIYRGLKGTHA